MMPCSRAKPVMCNCSAFYEAGQLNAENRRMTAHEPGVGVGRTTLLVWGQKRTLASTSILSTKVWARRRRLVAAAMTSSPALAGGAGPARMARAVARSNRVALGLMGTAGGVTGDVAKAVGTDDAEASKCQAFARKNTSFGAARCA